MNVNILLIRLNMVVFAIFIIINHKQFLVFSSWLFRILMCLRHIGELIIYSQTCLKQAVKG